MRHRSETKIKPPKAAHALSRSLFWVPNSVRAALVPLPLYMPSLSLLENETKLGTKKIVKLKLVENELNYFFTQKKPTLTLCFFLTPLWKQSRHVDIKLKAAIQSEANSFSRYRQDKDALTSLTGPLQLYAFSVHSIQVWRFKATQLAVSTLNLCCSNTASCCLKNMPFRQT